MSCILIAEETLRSGQLGHILCCAKLCYVLNSFLWSFYAFRETVRFVSSSHLIVSRRIWSPAVVVFDFASSCLKFFVYNCRLCRMWRFQTLPFHSWYIQA